MSYMGKKAAAEEIVQIKIERVLNAIGDDRRTRKLFMAEVRKQPTPDARLKYCETFRKDFEQQRQWANRHLWFISDAKKK